MFEITAFSVNAQRQATDVLLVNCICLQYAVPDKMSPAHQTIHILLAYVYNGAAFGTTDNG